MKGKPDDPKTVYDNGNNLHMAPSMAMFAGAGAATKLRVSAAPIQRG